MKVIKYIGAFLRLNKKWICEMSSDSIEFHDYPDGTIKVPIHFYTYTCERCGRRFII